MEKYSAACRLVMVCNNISKVLDAVRSRTLPVRVAAPVESEVVDILNYVAKKESFQLPPELASRIGVQRPGSLLEGECLARGCAAGPPSSVSACSGLTLSIGL